MIFENRTDWYKCDETDVIVDIDFLDRFKQLLQSIPERCLLEHGFSDMQQIDIIMEIDRLLENINADSE